MMTLRKKMRTSLLVVVLCLAVSSNLFVPTPVHALGVSFTEELPGPLLTAETVTAVNTTANNVGVTPKFALDALAWTLAKMTIQSITRSTVNWINSGFNGSPAFISDLNRNLSNLGDAVANDFFTHLNTESVQVTGFNIRSPFQDQLNQKLRQQYYEATSYYGLNYARCKYGNGGTYINSQFYKGQFSQGGLDAYFVANQYPDCNPFSSYQKLSNQLWSQIDAAAQQRKAELNWGQGFLPWRGSCKPSGADKNGNMVSLSQSESCYQNQVRTPGAIIEQTLGITATSPLRQLELADSINEIVSALMGQLVNQVLGPTGLSGVSQPSQGGGQSFLNQATNPSQYTQVSSSLSDGLVQSLTNDHTKIETYRTQWESVLDAVNAAQQRCGNTPEISIAAQKAQAGVTRANAALSTIDQLSTEVSAAAHSNAVNKSDLITQSVADYQGYLASPQIPNQSDLNEAALASSDSTSQDGSNPSTHMRMIALQQSCGA